MYLFSDRTYGKAVHGLINQLSDNTAKKMLLAESENLTNISLSFNANYFQIFQGVTFNWTFTLVRNSNRRNLAQIELTN
jgi:hypothetical protein